MDMNKMLNEKNKMLNEKNKKKRINFYFPFNYYYI